MAGFDWPVLMRAGLRGLGLSPEAFWRLTPAELALMLGEDPAREGARARSLSRARLEELAAAFPDLAGPLKGQDGHDRT